MYRNFFKVDGEVEGANDFGGSSCIIYSSTSLTKFVLRSARQITHPNTNSRY